MGMCEANIRQAKVGRMRRLKQHGGELSQ